MKNLLQKSELRQLLDTLGKQYDTDGVVDTNLVFKTCQSIAMIAADKDANMPLDVFAIGLNDRLCRQMLSSVCISTVQLLMRPQPGAPITGTPPARGSIQP